MRLDFLAQLFIITIAASVASGSGPSAGDSLLYQDPAIGTMLLTTSRSIQNSFAGNKFF